MASALFGGGGLQMNSVGNFICFQKALLRHPFLGKLNKNLFDSEMKVRFVKKLMERIQSCLLTYAPQFSLPCFCHSLASKSIKSKIFSEVLLSARVLAL